jgi:hypothetical protein
MTPSETSSEKKNYYIVVTIKSTYLKLCVLHRLFAILINISVSYSVTNKIVNVNKHHCTRTYSARLYDDDVMLSTVYFIYDLNLYRLIE